MRKTVQNQIKEHALEAIDFIDKSIEEKSKTNRIKLVFISNFVLIGIFFILKLIDFITSFIFIGYNGIYEANPSAIPFIENPTLLIFIFLLFIFVISSLNFLFYTKKNFNEFLNFFLIFIILLNLQGFWVVINNYEVFMMVM